MKAHNHVTYDDIEISLTDEAQVVIDLFDQMYVLTDNAALKLFENLSIIMTGSDDVS